MRRLMVRPCGITGIEALLLLDAAAVLAVAFTGRLWAIPALFGLSFAGRARAP